MHRGPEFLVPLGPARFCPMIPSLAGREVGPRFPALPYYRLRPRGGWQERTLAALKKLFDETQINLFARGDILVDPPSGLVPCDLTFEVRQIDLRLRLNEIRTGFDRSRAAFAAVRINITRDRCRGLVRLHVGGALRVDTLAQQRGTVVGDPTAVGPTNFSTTERRVAIILLETNSAPSCCSSSSEYQPTSLA